MSKSGISANKRNLRILAWAGAVGLWILFHLFVFSPLKAAADQSEQRVGELEVQIARGEQLIAEAAALGDENGAAAASVLRVYHEHLPPVSNPYSWAMETLSDLMEGTEQVVKVKPHTADRFVPVPFHANLNRASASFWVPYAVDVEMQTELDHLIFFLDRIRHQLPYGSLASLEVKALPSAPGRYSASMVVEWPVPRYEEDLQTLDRYHPGR